MYKVLPKVPFFSHFRKNSEAKKLDVGIRLSPLTRQPFNSRTKPQNYLASSPKRRERLNSRPDEGF